MARNFLQILASSKNIWLILDEHEKGSNKMKPRTFEAHLNFIGFFFIKRKRKKRVVNMGDIWHGKQFAAIFSFSDEI